MLGRGWERWDAGLPGGSWAPSNRHGLEPSEGPRGYILEAKGRVMECYVV